MSNTIYVVGLRSVFEPEFVAFQNGEGFYYDVGFKNWGAIRYSLDGQLVLLEETEDKFKPEHLALPDTQKFTLEEIKQYLIDNKENWQNDDEI